jgi:hypothetical protein
LIKVTAQLKMKIEILPLIQALQMTMKVMKDRYCHSRAIHEEIPIYEALIYKYRYEYETWMIPNTFFHQETENSMIQAEHYVHHLLPHCKRYYQAVMEMCGYLESNVVTFVSVHPKRSSISTIPIAKTLSIDPQHQHQHQQFLPSHRPSMIFDPTVLLVGTTLPPVTSSDRPSSSSFGTTPIAAPWKWLENPNSGRYYLIRDAVKKITNLYIIIGNLPGRNDLKTTTNTFRRDAMITKTTPSGVTKTIGGGKGQHVAEDIEETTINPSIPPTATTPTTSVNELLVEISHMTLEEIEDKETNDVAWVQKYGRARSLMIFREFQGKFRVMHVFQNHQE